jgi:16S rRNA (cytosine1402-N4)-methyltransferase
MSTLHVPVMLKEVLNGVGEKEGAFTFLDATLGLAGHSKAVLEKYGEAKIVGFDQDPQARKLAEENLKEYGGRFEIVADNFRNIGRLAEREDWQGAYATLFDLGVSNLQLIDGERGFSFQRNGPLDMRMDLGEINGKKTAKNILDSYELRDLTRIFREYGDEPFAFRIAKRIVSNRERGERLNTTGELTELIRDALPAPVQRKMRGHPARRVFQALRIEVNDELGALDEALDGAVKVTARGGRIIAISYHSLEDRMVKHRFRKWKEESLGRPNPRKAITPSDEEIESNYKARSAKLRIFEIFD